MTPLIALVFGRGVWGVTVVVSLVTFFPSLVNIVEALRSVPQASVDMVVAYGGGPLTVLRKVQMPFAIPGLLASVKIAVPGAILGATLAEWLITGKGLGNYMLTASATSDFEALWATAIVLAVVSVAFYVAIGAVERAALARIAGLR